MKLYTWREIKGKVQRKYGIETDSSYDEEELIDMVNEAINMTEAEVLKLNQDYFLASETIPVTSGVTEYDLPDGIFGMKLRRVWYQKPSELSPSRLYKAKNLDHLYNSDKLRYYILNNATGRKLVLSEEPNSDAKIILYYTRNATLFTVAGGDSQVCDIPEFVDAVTAWMGYLVEYKDKSPTTQQAKDNYDRVVRNLIDTLADAANDEDNRIEPDLTFDQDHVGGESWQY